MSAAGGAKRTFIATGPGSELRRPLGITIIGGLIVSQALTLYTTSVIYLVPIACTAALWAAAVAPLQKASLHAAAGCSGFASPRAEHSRAERYSAPRYAVLP